MRFVPHTVVAVLVASVVWAASGSGARTRVGGGPTAGTADTFISTSSSTRVANGQANFSCPNNPATSSPCLSNPNKPLEMGGVHATTPQDDSSDIYMGCMEQKDGGSCLEVLNNYGLPAGGSEIQLLRVMYDGTSRVAGNVEVNRQAGTDGRLISKKGPLYIIADGELGTAGPIYVWNKASSDVSTWYTGAGTQVLNLTAAGFVDISDGPSSNVCTLDGASPSKCTVTTVAGARCSCSVVSTAGAAPCTVNLVTTTLTAYSSNGLTNVVNVTCH